MCCWTTRIFTNWYNSKFGLLSCCGTKLVEICKLLWFMLTSIKSISIKSMDLIEPTLTWSQTSEGKHRAVSKLLLTNTRKANRLLLQNRINTYYTSHRQLKLRFIGNDQDILTTQCTRWHLSEWRAGRRKLHSRSKLLQHGRWNSWGWACTPGSVELAVSSPILFLRYCRQYTRTI